MNPGKIKTRFVSFLALTSISAGTDLQAQPSDKALRDESIQALKQAATYYCNEVASHGGYVYYYSTDLQQPWGEGKASADTIFVQPPGTPTVGEAYLQAYAATGDGFYLE